MYVYINGKKWDIPEVTFDAICTLEEKGVNLLNMNTKDMKVASMLRGLVAWIEDVEPEVASVEIQNHIQNGGDIGEILQRVTAAITESGFFGRKKVQQMPKKGQENKNTTRPTQN